jgi:hypothetical protein
MNYLFVVSFLLGNFPAPEFYMPTFRNTLFHLQRRVGMKMEQCVLKCRHIKFRHSGNYPEESIQHPEHGKIWNEELFIYLLTPCSGVLLEKLIRSQLVKKFPAFYWTRRFVTAFTSARHLCLSWACWPLTLYRYSAIIMCSWNCAKTFSAYSDVIIGELKQKF